MVLSLNVRALSSRLPSVLSLPPPILALTEVRVPRTSQKTMRRLARMQGYDGIFGVPPPPSPTFLSSPGGVALFTRLPYTVRKIHPVSLHSWEANGRMLIGEILLGSFSSFVLVGIYGYAPSHPEVSTNDELLADAFAWAGAQKCCTLVTGDLNTTTTQSMPLASCREFGLHRISPNKPTTGGRNNPTAKTQAIDHMLVNESLLQHMLACDVDYTVAISDHYPLVSTFSFPLSSFLSWLPPRPPPSSFPPASAFPSFPSFVPTFEEWSQCARKWIMKAHGTYIPPKHVMVTTCDLPKPPKPPRKCAFLLKTMRAYQHVSQLSTPHPCQIRALEKKLAIVLCVNLG